MRRTIVPRNLCQEHGLVVMNCESTLVPDRILDGIVRFEASPVWALARIQGDAGDAGVVQNSAVRVDDDADATGAVVSDDAPGAGAGGDAPAVGRIGPMLEGTCRDGGGCGRSL